jgi:periplasmic protein TonB
MAHSAHVRAGSLAVSAALLGAGAIVALTFSYSLPTLNLPPDIAPVEVEVEVRPPQTPEQPPTAPLRLPDVAQEVTSLEIAATEVTELPQESSGEIGTAVIETIERPRWLRRPSNLQRYFPRQALRAGAEGDVTLDCLVRTSGLLECGIVSETPTGRGFAEAALRIAADHRMVPAMRDGVVVEGRYRMRVPFRVE